MVFLSRSNLAGVSVVAILSPILFVAAFRALATPSTATAAHTASTANTMSVTWERKKEKQEKKDKKQKTESLRCKIRLAQNLRAGKMGERKQDCRV